MSKINYFNKKYFFKITSIVNQKIDDYSSQDYEDHKLLEYYREQQEKSNKTFF